MASRGVKTRKKKIYHRYGPNYKRNDKGCMQRYCPSCSNTYCRHRKPLSAFKGYTKPKDRNNLTVVGKEESKFQYKYLIGILALLTIIVLLLKL